MSYGILGGMFVGIGMMALLFALSWMFYHIGRNHKALADVEETYSYAELLTIEKIMKEKGIDIREEMEKRSFKNKKTFRRELHKKVMEDMLTKK